MWIIQKFLFNQYVLEAKIKSKDISWGHEIVGLNPIAPIQLLNLISVFNIYKGKSELYEEYLFEVIREY